MDWEAEDKILTNLLANIHNNEKHHAFLPLLILLPRGDKDAVMSSILLARVLGRASARLNAFVTRFWVSRSFLPTEEKQQVRKQGVFS